MTEFSEAIVLFCVASLPLVVVKFSSKIVRVRSPIRKLSNANPSPPSLTLANANLNTTFPLGPVIVLVNSFFDSTQPLGEVVLVDEPDQPISPDDCFPGFEPIT